MAEMRSIICDSRLKSTKMWEENNSIRTTNLQSPIYFKLITNTSTNNPLNYPNVKLRCPWKKGEQRHRGDLQRNRMTSMLNACTISLPIPSRFTATQGTRGRSIKLRPEFLRGLRNGVWSQVRTDSSSSCDRRDISPGGGDVAASLLGGARRLRPTFVNAPGRQSCR